MGNIAIIGTILIALSIGTATEAQTPTKCGPPDTACTTTASETENKDEKAALPTVAAARLQTLSSDPDADSILGKAEKRAAR